MICDLNDGFHFPSSMIQPGSRGICVHSLQKIHIALGEKKPNASGFLNHYLIVIALLFLKIWHAQYVYFIALQDKLQKLLSLKCSTMMVKGSERLCVICKYSLPFLCNLFRVTDYFELPAFVGSIPEGFIMWHSDWMTQTT